MIREVGPIDILCFTGDVAQSGQLHEYGEASEFFTRTLNHLNLTADHLFIVPGNHDIDRSISSDCWERMREVTNNTKEARAFSRWMNIHTVQSSTYKPNWRRDILAREKAFRTWLQQTFPHSLPPEGQLGFHATKTINGIPLHIFGLDTAWLAGDEHDHEHLWMTEDQLMRLATTDKGEPVDGFRIALMHHPLSDLHPADRDRCQPLLHEYSDLILRGHLHESGYLGTYDLNHSSREFSAGTIFDGSKGEDHPNDCQIFTLSIDEQNQLVKLEVWVRAWSVKSRSWYDDNARYKGSKEGRVLVSYESDPNAVKKVTISRERKAHLRETMQTPRPSDVMDIPPPSSILPPAPTEATGPISRKEDEKVNLPQASERQPDESTPRSKPRGTNPAMAATVIGLPIVEDHIPDRPSTTIPPQMPPSGNAAATGAESAAPREQQAPKTSTTSSENPKRSPLATTAAPEIPLNPILPERKVVFMVVGVAAIIVLILLALHFVK